MENVEPPPNKPKEPIEILCMQNQNQGKVNLNLNSMVFSVENLGLENFCPVCKKINDHVLKKHPDLNIIVSIVEVT